MKKICSLLLIAVLMLSLFVVPVFADGSNENSSTGHTKPPSTITSSWPKEGYLKKRQGEQDVTPEHQRVGSSASWVMVGSTDVEDFFREYPTLLEEARNSFTLQVINKSGISETGVETLKKITGKKNLDTSIQWNVVENKVTLAKVAVKLSDLATGKGNQQTMANYERLEETQKRFDKRFETELMVVGIGGTDTSVPAQVSVKLPSFIQEENLQVYLFDHNGRNYFPIKTSVTVDGANNVHFATDLKYDAILSNGPLG